MKMNVKALAMAVGVLWAACILFIGLAHVMWPSYGGALLELAASIYPGFHPANGIGAVIVGTLYGLVDGAIGGAVIAWLYNSMGRVAQES